MKRINYFIFVICLFLPFLTNFNNINFNNKKIKKSKINEAQIHLTKESEFKPKIRSLDWQRHEINGIIADNDSKYNDGSKRWTSFYEENNGIFEFDLNYMFKSITIDETIKVAGLYDQYYSIVEVLFPVGADTLVRSQEIFNLKGKAIKGGPEVLVSHSSVAIIVDRWGSDNFGYSNVDWYMSLSDDGRKMTLRCKGYETGNIWGVASPVWTISEITTANEGDKEYHSKEGSGATFINYYAFQTPEDYEDNFLNLVGEI